MNAETFKRTYSDVTVVTVDSGERERKTEHWHGMATVIYAYTNDGREWELTSDERNRYKAAQDLFNSGNEAAGTDAISQLEADVYSRFITEGADEFTTQSY